MYQFLKTNISKLLGPLILAICAWLAVHVLALGDTGSGAQELHDKIIAIAPQINDIFSCLFAALLMAAKGLIERSVAAKVNPSNVAKLG